MPVNQCVCVPMFALGERSRGEFIEDIAAIGYPAIEIWARGDDFAALLDEAARANLRVVSMIGHGSLPDGLNNPANHDRIERELRQSIDLAAQSGISNLICFSGNRIEDMGEAEAIANTAAGFRRVAAYAEEKEITLNLELLNSKVNHAGYQCDHTQWGLAVLEQVQSSHVKLLYDIYHMQIMEGDIIRTLVDHIDAIGHVHTAGNPGRHELDDNQELNYRAICRALSQAGYRGYVGHEFRPKGDLIESLRQAYALCDVE